MRQEHTPSVDGLIHGRRRWLFMEPKNFLELESAAKEVLEPASGFMFFEQQLGELIEDFGLGGKGKKYFVSPPRIRSVCGWSLLMLGLLRFVVRVC